MCHTPYIRLGHGATSQGTGKSRRFPNLRQGQAAEGITEEAVVSGRADPQLAGNTEPAAAGYSEEFAPQVSRMALVSSARHHLFRLGSPLQAEAFFSHPFCRSPGRGNRVKVQVREPRTRGQRDRAARPATDLVGQTGPLPFVARKARPSRNAARLPAIHRKRRESDMAIVVPAEGRPAEAIGAAVLEGVDGNAFFIMGATQRELKRAGASKAFTDAYYAEATSGDYDHLIAASVAYLEAE